MQADDIENVLDDVETLRNTGGILADELSLLAHTHPYLLSGRCRDAILDWDALSFPLRHRIRREKEKIAQLRKEFAKQDFVTGLATSCATPAEKAAS